MISGENPISIEKNVVELQIVKEIQNLQRMNAIPSNCIVTKLDRQQKQGNDVMSLLYFDINLYHLRTRRDTGSRDLNTARLYNSITT